MSTRTIVATISKNDSTDLKDGGYAQFTVTSDTGPVTGGAVTSAKLTVGSMRCYATTAVLDVLYNDPEGTVLASTGNLSGDSTVHSEVFALTNCSAALVTWSVDNIVLMVDATSGTGNKANFREDCAITLSIEYTIPPTPCGAPSNVTLPYTSSPNYAVPLNWSAGSSGTNNALAYYEIARLESEDGTEVSGTPEVVATTKNLTYAVFPPDITGHSYYYYVRAVGTAGEAYASPWAMCPQPLLRSRPTLVPYTDAAIVAGETTIKAVHITELQTNVNRLRQGKGLAGYSFTTITAGVTSLAGWSGHVAELRAAIDEMDDTHDAWIDIPVNCPTAAVMMQLREVVESI